MRVRRVDCYSNFGKLPKLSCKRSLFFANFGSNVMRTNFQLIKWRFLSEIGLFTMSKLPNDSLESYWPVSKRLRKKMEKSFSASREFPESNSEWRTSSDSFSFETSAIHGQIWLAFWSKRHEQLPVKLIFSNSKQNLLQAVETEGLQLAAPVSVSII